MGKQKPWLNPDRDPGPEWLEIAQGVLDDVPSKTRDALKFEIACGLRAAYDQGIRKGWQGAIDLLIQESDGGAQS